MYTLRGGFRNERQVCKALQIIRALKENVDRVSLSARGKALAFPHRLFRAVKRFNHIIHH